MDVRDQIVEVATRLFAVNGFDSTPLQAIADEVGIRKASLLYHFRSKDTLRRNVLDTMLSHWNEALPRLLKATASGEDQFEAIVKEMVRFFAADPNRARLLVREALDRPDETHKMIGEHVRPWVDIICNYIRKGKQLGVLQQDVDPEAYVVQVINLVVASVATFECIGSLMTPDQTGTDVFARHIRELMRVAHSSLFVARDASRHGENDHGTSD